MDWSDDLFGRTMHWWRKRGARWLWRSALALLLALVLFLSLVPIGRYLARAGWEEAKIMWRRRPIETLVSDPSVAPAISLAYTTGRPLLFGFPP